MLMLTYLVGVALQITLLQIAGLSVENPILHDWSCQHWPLEGWTVPGPG